MKERRLLYAIGWVRDDFLEEMNQSGSRRAKTMPKKRLWLVAAIIAVMLLLAGCVSVYLWLQDRSIGQETYTQRFDAEGHYIAPTEKTADVVTLFGSGGSDIQKALAEWLEFKRNYPDFLELNLTDEDAEKIPERYRYTYDCYTVEMVEKLEEIAEKYSLKLLDTEIPIQRYQYETAMEVLGLTSLLRPDAEAAMENGQGGIRLPHNLLFEFFVDLKDSDAPWAENILVNYSYAQAGYFPGFGSAVLDLEEVEQWKYTTKDGTSLLLALDRKGRGIVLAEREDAMIYLDVDSNFGGPNFPNPEDVMDREGLERLADAFDYSIIPQPVNPEVLQPRLDADQKTYNERMQDAVTTYAGFTEFLLENAHMIPTRHYAFHDLDGDGTEEMILGGPGVEYTRILHENQGKVREHGWFCDFRVLENGGFLTLQNDSPEVGSSLYYAFYPPMASGCAMRFDYSGNGPELRHEEWERSLQYRDGIWKNCTSWLDTGTVIPEEEAQAIMDQYPEKELDWQPVWDYPVDASGTTLGNVLRARKNPVTQEEAMAFYADAIRTGDVPVGSRITHFALRDVTGDGIIDLLFSPDGERLFGIYACRYGKAYFWDSTTSYLCEGNVLLRSDITKAEDGADLDYYRFQYCEASQNRKTLAEIQRNRASGQWTDLMTNTPMTEAQAQEILGRYPRISLVFRDVEELLK